MDGAEKKGNMPTSPTMLSGTVKLVTFAPPTVAPSMSWSSKDSQPSLEE
jgi:hypothetical protein